MADGATLVGPTLADSVASGGAADEECAGSAFPFVVGGVVTHAATGVAIAKKAIPRRRTVRIAPL